MTTILEAHGFAWFCRVPATPHLSGLAGDSTALFAARTNEVVEQLRSHAPAADDRQLLEHIAEALEMLE